MIVPRIASLVAALLLVPHPELLGPEPPFAFGDRIRVLAPSVSPEQLVGSFITMNPDSLVMLVENGKTRLHVDDLVA